jgi:hypothetical protein
LCSEIAYETKTAQADTLPLETQLVMTRMTVCS